jgi:putative endonuclease
MYIIYWLIDFDNNKTYVGFTDDLKKRIADHKYGKTKTTRKFKISKVYILERVETLELARKREKYWKSAAGRRKLKEKFSKIMALSSNG